MCDICLGFDFQTPSDLIQLSVMMGRLQTLLILQLFGNILNI